MQLLPELLSGLVCAARVLGFFLGKKEDQRLNPKRGVRSSDCSPPNACPLVLFRQGDRVIGVTGTSAMAEECIADQKVTTI